ncbi:MAG: anaerobic ribonucleoside-triphosphate reductase activating protein [Clostridiales bacterium]|jgi:anaerobic ribonucleoside-triphosphate reductase activating protein|nr:anaerobic ribonucleoside-triphosphate reductase activating protein [Clostridiales bacterium]
MTLRIAGTIDDSIVDGPGVRTVVFTQGCPHRCPGCHNTHALDPKGGRDADTDALAAGILSNPLSDGATFSGGEPFMQPKPLAELARTLKSGGKNIVAYTGYTFEYLLEEADADRLALLGLCDILIDGPYLEAERDLTLDFRGSRNQRILDCAKSLKKGEATEWER